MSWQSDFDSTGPKWEGSATAKAEEDRLRKMMDEIKSKVAKHNKTTINASVFEELDQEMTKLHQREHDLIQLCETASSEEEIGEINSHLSKVRAHFYQLKNDYIRFKQLASTVD